MWTKESIHKLLDGSNNAVMRALVAIYRLQTDTEKASHSTRDHNNVGFSAYDAEFCTSLAKQVLQKRTLSPKQLAIARNKMKRYHRQLCEIANAKEAQAALVQQPTVQAADPVMQAEQEMIDSEMAAEQRFAVEIQRQEKDEEFRRMRAKYEWEMQVHAGQWA